tara:strand:+ start:7248 stop:7478 length:231 start_codon:yes stop_codon:yes gene_type:complete
MTPLEEAIKNATNFTVSLAVSAVIIDLLVRGDQATHIALDRSNSMELRARALQEARQINQLLNAVAIDRSERGITC